MQQNPINDDVNGETESQSPTPSSDDLDLVTAHSPLPEDVDADEVVEAYRARQSNGADQELDDSSTTEDEDFTNEHPSESNLNVAEHQADERVGRFIDDENEEEDDDDDDALLVSLPNKRVLLIEDDDDTTEILKQNLQALGITKVNVAANAEGALNQLATDREMFPDIIVLELALIGMDGIQFLAQLRAHKSKKLQNLPAVVITMLDSPSIFRRAARQNVGAFLRKPVSTQGLKAGIEAALRGDIVEQPFSQPKSWLDDVDEEELREKRNSIKAKAAAKAEKKGFWVWLLNTLVPWSGRI